MSRPNILLLTTYWAIHGYCHLDSLAQIILLVCIKIDRFNRLCDNLKKQEQHIVPISLAQYLVQLMN
jgi:hypothetical protein